VSFQARSEARYSSALAPTIVGSANESALVQPCREPAQPPPRHSRVVALPQLAVWAMGPPVAEKVPRSRPARALKASASSCLDHAYSTRRCKWPHNEAGYDRTWIRGRDNDHRILRQVQQPRRPVTDLATTGKSFRSAPTTINDLHATSSHRGGHGISAVRSLPSQRGIRLSRTWHEGLRPGPCCRSPNAVVLASASVACTRA
jgi:hypothetical protein